MTQTIIPGYDRKLSNRVTLKQTLANIFTMAHRSILKTKHNPEALFDVVSQPIIFTAMFTYIFGGAIAGDVKSYLPIVIPGILAQTIITSSVTTGIQLREDMDKGVFDRFRSLPIARIAPLGGALLADTVRYLIATTLTFVMGYIMGWRPAGGIVAVIFAGILVIFCAWSISWIFAFFGVVARSASSVQGISFLVLFPMTFLSNAYVPVETMPGWIQAIAKANPVTYLIKAVREICMNQSYVADLTKTLVGAVIVLVIFAPLALKAYMKKS